MAGQVHAAYGITSLRSACEHRSEKSVLAGPRLGSLFDRLPVKQCGHDLGALWDGRRAPNPGVRETANGVLIRDVNRSCGEAAGEV